MDILCTPNTNDVEKYIESEYFENKRILHIVPTMILYKRRIKFYRNILPKKNKSIKNFYQMSQQEITTFLTGNNIFLFELNRFFEYITSKSEYKVLKNREAFIILERILKNNPSTSSSTWFSLVSEIYELFQKISIADVPIKKLYSFGNDKSWSELVKIYDLYLKELKSLNIMDKGLAYKKIISNGHLEGFDSIYIDGAFLPIQPLLHKLIHKLSEYAKKILFFIPFDLKSSDNPAFGVLKKTYEPYVPISKWKSINQDMQNHNVVEKLARNIFTGKTIQIDDHSVEIVEFDTLEDEISSLVDKAVNIIKKGRTIPQKIAIITPKAMEIRPIVGELIELHNLKFDVSERPLIQLPFGKLIFWLYQIYLDDRIRLFSEYDHHLDLDMLTDLLHTNLIEKTIDINVFFENIKVFFEDCITFDDWHNQVKQLKNAKSLLNDNFSYHPLYFITNDQLDDLDNVLFSIKQLSEKLINAPDLTFNGHIDFMINIIKSDSSLKELALETENRLINIRESLGKHENIKINVKEFAGKIQSIFKDNFTQETENTNNQLKITVTGPNNVEYQEYDYVFLARFTQNIYPETVSYKWPMNLNIEYAILKYCTKISCNNVNDFFKYYLDRSIYYLFIVINATRKQLTISFSKNHNGIDQSLSHYLHDIAKVFNIEEELNSKEKLEDILKKYGLLLSPSKNNNKKMSYSIDSKNFSEIKEDSIISIEEIAIYEYCPRRFYYEKKYPEKRVYTDIFHLQYYASSCLYEETIKVLVNEFSQIDSYNKEKIIKSLDRLIKKGLKNIEELFPFGMRYWTDIKVLTKFRLKSLVEKILSAHKSQKALISLGGQKIMRQINGYTFCGERELQVKYSDITHYYSISNFKEFLSFPINNNEFFSPKFKKIKKEYQKLLSEFCYENKEADLEINSFIEKINNQKFEKNSGIHCQYCAFRKDCMKKEILFNEIHN